jgi:PKD repeat protein
MGQTARSRNRRGQSTIIGFVLVFAIVIMLLVTLQVVAVPTWNQSVEYDHNQRLQDDLEQYRTAAFGTAADGRLASESIELGTRYPTRPFLLNPADPSGSIRTTAVGNVSIEGATASGEARDYWNGTARNFTTRHLTYRPDYNEYANAPTTVLENSVLYNRFGERSLPITPERLVRGNDITLVTLNGSLDRGSSGTYDLEAVPLSASEEVTTVRSDGTLNVSVPTRLSESDWRTLLEDELVENDGRVWLNVTRGEPYDTLTLTLTSGTYDLRMAKIGVGSRQSEPEAHYITVDSTSDRQIAPGQTERLVFTVRDRYNNPVSGVRVKATPGDLAGLSPVDPITDSNGQAVFRYEGTDPGQATVTAQFEDGLTRRQRANVTITTSSAGGESSLGVEWIGFGDGRNESDPFDVEASGSDTTLTLTSEPAVKGLDIEYVVSNETVGTVDPGSSTTDADGQDTVTFTAKNDGVVTVYAIGAGDVDTTTITVVNAATDPNESPTADFTVAPESPAVGETVSFDGDGSTDVDGTIESYEWAFGDGGTATGPTPTHTYDSPGTYTVTLTVTDDDGATDTTTGTVDIASSYSVTIQRAEPSGGNNIATTVDVTAADPGATIRVEALRNDSSVRDTTTTGVTDSQPQTVVTNGQRQITHIRVLVFNAGGTEQARTTVRYPYP